MKTIILGLVLILVSFNGFSQAFKITRFEQSSDALFICINSAKTPSYVEHFFTDTERKDSIEIKKTIEYLIARLRLMDDEYIKPVVFVSNLTKAQKYKFDTLNISKQKIKIMLQKKVRQDSINSIKIAKNEK